MNTVSNLCLNALSTQPRLWSQATRGISLAFLGLSMMACAASGGGGGGGGIVGHGGAETTVCDPTYSDVGCYGNFVMKCDATAKTWSKVQECPTQTFCAEEPAGNKFTASCKPLATGGTSSDATTGSDGTSSGSDATSSADVSVAQMTSCMKDKCATSWNACQANPACKTIMECLMACAPSCPKDNACLKTMPDATTTELMGALGKCAEDMQCVPKVPPKDNCGNGKCDPGETTSSCPADCKTAGPVCGNGACEPGETTASCPQDCKPDGPVCGNGKCESGETKASCPGDCGTTTTTDCSGSSDQAYLKTVNFSSMFSSVVQSCVISAGCLNQSGDAQAKCIGDCIAGQGKLSAGCSQCFGSFSSCTIANCMDSCASNPTASACQTCSLEMCGQILADCKGNLATGGPVCGNGACESGETSANCSADCGGGTCTPKCTGKYCGDSDGCTGKCSGPCANGGVCSAVKVCSTPSPVCGNGKCESGETKTNCAKDCGGTGTAVCGNLICETGENVTSCKQDCDPQTICFMNACPTEITTCVGNAACAGILQCLQACTDAACQNKCVSSASSATQAMFMAMNECIGASGCTASNPVCGNGACEAGETKANCPSDCGGGGGAHFCDANCGGSGTGCYCDSSCKQYGDCCDATGTAKAGNACTGSTCADCK